MKYTLVIITFIFSFAIQAQEISVDRRNMSNRQYFKILSNQIAIFTVGFLILFLNALIVDAQFAPTLQNNMLFGSFINNVPVGSTVHLVLASDATGTVTADPGLIEITSAPQSAACMRIYFAKKDTHHAVTITYGPSVSLKNGSYSILFTPPVSTKTTDASWSNSSTSYQDIYIGGTLTIGSPSVNPAGTYSGTFKVYYTYNLY